ncbi:hypothetical protein YPPY10_4394, partial [Yersinia pestis PY-10]
MITPR